MQIFLITILILLFLTSILIIFTNSYRRAILLSASASLVASVIYLIMGAPDVALAEAVIGCTFSTIVMLMAIKHLKIVNVAYKLIDMDNKGLTKVFANEFSREDYDVHFISSNEEIKIVLERYDEIDFYVVENFDNISLYHFDEYISISIVEGVSNLTHKPIQVIKMVEGEVFEA